MQAQKTEDLSPVLDKVNEAYFWDRPPSENRRAGWSLAIAARYGLTGAYAGTFALSPRERQEGIRLFTGERVRSAAARHIAGEEACRALRLMRTSQRSAKRALIAAGERLARCVGPIGPRTTSPGMVGRFDPYGGGVFCCGPCTAAVWRHLALGGFDRPGDRLAIGLTLLKTYRRPEGDWRSFPFWYTVSALVEVASLAPRIVSAELAHAGPRLERATGRADREGSSEYARRRSELARRALALC